MKINKFFENEYLVAGNTYDNFIFENCPSEFLHFARLKLSEKNENVKSCVCFLDRNLEESVELIFNCCADELQKKVLARDFITAIVIKELFNDDIENEAFRFVSQQINAFINNDFDAVKNMHAESFMPFDIKRMMKSVGKIEVSFILDGTQNKHIQQAINIFISSREPYSVKVFTNNERLSTYYDLNGNIIECPHDFMRRNVNDFIEENSEQKEQ